MGVGGRSLKKKKFGIGEMFGDEEDHKIWSKLPVPTVNFLIHCDGPAWLLSKGLLQ